MLKRVRCDQLRVGMFLHELCGSWMDHPFWRSAFLLSSQQELDSLRNSAIREVWIDTAKGLDVAADEAQPGEDLASVEQAVEVELVELAERPVVPAPCSMAEELQRASRICRKAKDAVQSMFSEARMGKALNAADALPLVEEISNSVMRNPGALISLARLKTKDNYTYMHSVAVCALMVALSRQLGQDAQQTREAGMAGLLHDLGKMWIPPEILNKPGRLTDAEFDVVRRHPLEGWQALREAQGVSEVTLDVCLHHHEKMDGSGYPHELLAEQISLFARMGAVCDVYDAITSNRPYKKGWCPAESLRKMTEWCAGHFDEDIFHAFVRSLGIYPIGSLLRLKSGRIAVVVEQSSSSLLAPIVLAFFSTRSNARIIPVLVDLSEKTCRDGIAGREDPAKWNFPDLDALWLGEVARIT
jgi:HD-GYP domain-containing protein (c-di-GMP phosphodiesterase class II)